MSSRPAGPGICGHQDCDHPPHRPGQPLCLKHYRMAQAGQIDECPNCPGVYKPSEYPVCRECYQQNRRRPAAGQIREQRDQYADESKGWDQQPQPEVTAPTSEAARVIGQARTNLTFHQQECENHETSTIQYLIMPVLAGLGWDIHDPAQVGTEYRPTGNRNVRPDIALMYNGAPVAFIEAKRLDRGYSPDYREQLSKYAECLGDGSTAVLTNGRFWQICSVSGGKPLLRETIDVNRGAAEEVAAKLSDALGKSMLQVDVGNTSRTTGTSQQTAPNREKIRGDLRRYRDGEAERQGMSPYVLTNAIISLIAEQCPTDLRQLREISGVGPATIEQHGDSIIRIIRGR